MPPPPPRALPDELLEEILLRLPPEDPGCLFSASLVCKPWRIRLTSSAFSRLYREFHRTPPLLGFFENDEKVCCWFSPFSHTSPVLPVHPGHQDLFALDSRHGLVLLTGTWEEPLVGLVVWDPVRRRQWELPMPEYWGSGNAAVLCAVDGCDHLDCRGDSFLVVYVGTDVEGVAHACVYSSEATAWGPVTSCEHPAFSLQVISPWPTTALVGSSVYFLCTSRTIILRYDLLTHELSVITSPAMSKWKQDNRVLMGMEDGVLGCAALQESRLQLWAMEFRTDGTVEWELRRVIDLHNWLPSRSSYVVNFADGVGIFFVRTNIGIFTVELKSGRVKKISRRKDQVIPYMRFYTPDQSGGVTPTSTMASSENVEAAQDKHRDLLLPHSSGEVGDDKEKWVENGEEDSEWEKGEGSEEDWEWRRKKAAQDLFEDGSEAIEEGDFGRAQSLFSDALDYMVLYYGRFSTMCISTYYKYGLALLYEAQCKNAPYQDLLKGTTRRVDTRSSKASGSNIWEGDTGKDLNLAWKMLHIARAILEKSPCISKEKVEIFCALAEVSLEREDIDYSLRAWSRALAILEHLVEPDHCRIILLNLHIFLAFKSASKIGDALPYAAKVYSLFESRMEKLRKANGALLADKCDNASAAEVGSEKSLIDKEIEFLTIIFTVLGKELQDLGHAMLTPISKASGMHNAGCDSQGAASLTSEIAGPSNSMSTEATTESRNLRTAGHASSKLMSSRTLLNLAVRNFQRVLHL